MSIWTNSLLALALLLPVAAAAQTLRVAVPAGYCVDADTVRGMMLAAPCDGSDALPAMLTVMTGAEGSDAGLADRAGVADWLNSAPGREALSRRGRSRDVTVLELRGRGDALLIRLRDTAIAGDSWRVLVPLRDRLVTLTVSGALPPEQGRTLADAFLRAMRQANRG